MSVVVMWEATQARAVLFDVTGVLLKFEAGVILPRLRTLVGMVEDGSADDINAYIELAGPLVHDFDLGRVNESQFLTSFAERYSLTPAGLSLASEEELLALLRKNFTDGFFSMHQHTQAMIDSLFYTYSLKDATPLFMGIVSNMNPMHWRSIRKSFPVLYPEYEYFSVHALSFELGTKKPDARIFEYAMEELNKKCKRMHIPPIDAREVLFLDDSPGHLRGAEALGIQTALVDDANPQTIQSALAAHGISV